MFCRKRRCRQLSVGYQFWSYQVPANPRTTYDEYRVEGLKPINDINGDGINDVIIATDNYFIMALDGAAAELPIHYGA